MSLPVMLVIPLWRAACQVWCAERLHRCLDKADMPSLLHADCSDEMFCMLITAILRDLCLTE
jgi:hypothetical protein